MRVIHCIYDDANNPWVGGGGAVRLDEIYRRISGEVQVTLVTGRFPGASDRVSDGIRRNRVGAASPYAWSRLTYGAAASRLLARERYDAGVFDFSAYSPVVVPGHRPVGVMLGQMAGPTAASRWGSAAGTIVHAWERRQLRRARSVAAVSHWLLREARPLLRADADVRVVGAGVDEGYFRVPRHERDYLLYYGRFDVFQKGIDILLDAYAALSTTDRVPLRIAGRGRDAPKIASMVRERGLADVEMIIDPPAERVHALMGGALALVMPSRFEGFGMVAAEAMAAGVPVVAARVDALPEVIGEAGVLVPAEDADATSSALRRLTRDAAARATLSAAARVRARRFSWDEVAGDHLRWLRDIAGEPSPSPSRSR
jgi:glycosyltransferase involved in cell wall biosynthesis